MSKCLTRQEVYDNVSRLDPVYDPTYDDTNGLNRLCTYHDSVMYWYGAPSLGGITTSNSKKIITEWHYRVEIDLNTLNLLVGQSYCIYFPTFTIKVEGQRNSSNPTINNKYTTYEGGYGSNWATNNIHPGPVVMVEAPDGSNQVSITGSTSAKAGYSSVTLFIDIGTTSQSLEITSDYDASDFPNLHYYITSPSAATDAYTSATITIAPGQTLTMYVDNNSTITYPT